jgi:predicted transposase/invertase (TIGR01784 family)
MAPVFSGTMPVLSGHAEGGTVAEHDGAYKLLFSHPEMVADLLRDFIDEEWVKDIDLSTLEPVPGSYITPELSSRESDIVWRVRWGRDHLLYVYLLMEFQSKVDPWMALRMTVYLGLLYQDLIKRQEISGSGKLPPVLPLVLYNGNALWGAAQEVSELVEEIPGGLERYRPRLRYCLLDEMRMADSELESLRNVAAALFRLEKSRGPDDIQRIVTTLLEWLRGPEFAELRRSFARYLRKSLLPARMSGIEIPEVTELEEVKSMLADRVTEWTQQWKQEGLEEGLQKGQENALEQARGVLLEDLERRFGSLPEIIRKRIEAIASIREMTELSLRAGAAPSLATLAAGLK